MAITVEELEAAGYVIHRAGKITHPDREVNVYVLKDRENAEVFLPRQEGKNRPWTYVRVHRMVAEKYVPNPKKLRTVGFKRGDSCRASNLYWCEPVESAKTAKTKRRRLGLVMLELGEISWDTAWKKYGVNRTTAYNTWRKVHAK